MRRSRRRAQRGVALLTAIVLVALATVLAVAIAFHTAMTARRGAGSFTVEQGLQFGAGAEVLAAYALREDAKPRQSTSGPAVQQDFPGEPWTTRFQPTEIAPEVVLEAQLGDESGKFNLNSLVGPDGRKDEESVAIFEYLLRLLKLDPKWASMMVDWIDADQQQESAGAEDGVYTSLRPPHRTANGPVTSISELMALPGFTRENYLLLAPHVTALPPAAREINVCFASAFVLDALESAYNQAVSQSYSQQAQQDPDSFAQLQNGRCGTSVDVISRAINDATARDRIKKRIVEQSRYFRLHTWVTIGTTRFALYSLMERQSASQISVIYRTFGTE